MRSVSDIPAWHLPYRQQLAALVASARVPHAVLFSGATGLGKRALAEYWLALLLCTAPVDAAPCGSCQGCRLLRAHTHPDLYRVALAPNREGKLRSEIVIEQVREVCERLMLASALGGRRVALIDPADALNAAAANALLKTLEEPPADTVLLLLADHPERMPATLRSRCRRLHLQPPSSAQALDWLAQQGLSGSAAQAALEAARGNPGQALTSVREGLLQRREAVRSELAQALTGRADLLALAQSWARDEPAERLRQAAQWLAQELAAQCEGRRGPLASGRDARALAQWYEQANRLRALLRGPVRAEPLLLDFLALRAAA